MGFFVFHLFDLKLRFFEKDLGAKLVHLMLLEICLIRDLVGFGLDDKIWKGVSNYLLKVKF